MGGGAEALLTTIMNALDDTGRYQIGVMEIIHASIKSEPIHKSIRVYPYYTDADAPDRKERMYFVYHEWEKVIKDYIPQDYDIYVSFNYLRPSFLLPKNKKSIAWIHSDVYDLINKYPNQIKDMSEECELQRKAFKSVNRIIPISDITKQSIEDIFPEFKNKTELLPNGIDVERIKRMAEINTDVALEGYAIIVVGRLETRKNPLRALTIFERVLKSCEDANLYYLGYGDLEEEIYREISKRDLFDHVHFLGYHDNPFPIIRQARLTLMTSYSEGFPMSLLESVALGVPYVSSVVGGSRMLCQNKPVGAVFHTDDEAVEEILNYSKFDIKTIRKYCEEVITEYDLPQYICKIENIINEVLIE